MAGPGLFIHTFRGPNDQMWEAGGRDLWPWPPNSTPCLFACPSVLLPFHVGGREWQDPEAFQCVNP